MHLTTEVAQRDEKIEARRAGAARKGAKKIRSGKPT